MPRIEWDKIGERFFETGTDRGVLYPMEGNTYGNGVPWNGLTAVSESPSGAEASPFYADNIKYLNIMSAEEFGYSIEAYSSPEEFDECDGTKEIAPGVFIGQQSRKLFGFSYRTMIGNDIEGTDHGYKVHLVYGSLAQPSEKGYGTISDSTEPMTLSWECSTTPVSIAGFKPTAHIVIDSRRVEASKLAELEAILYGSDEAEARLPMPAEIIELLGVAAG